MPAMPTYRVFHQALPANINGPASVRTEAFAPGVTLEQVI
jgi:hypothetical protein